jgi:hypothetical protein
MAQLKANSDFPQPGRLEESSCPMIDPVKWMEMMLRSTAFQAVDWPAIAISTPIGCGIIVASKARSRIE